MNKTKTLFATIIILTMTASIFVTFAPQASAVTFQIDTYAFMKIAPNPVGVNQQVLVSYQIDKTSPTANGISEGDHFTGFTITITKPDGKTETRGPFTAFAMSGAYFYYVPTEVGNYTFQTNFPGQWINTTTFSNGGYARNSQYYFKPSQSPLSQGILTVQQEPIPPYPNVPLPTGYWTLPIYGENKGWGAISDNWLMQGYDYPTRAFTAGCAFAPYTSAPNSAHILWTTPIEIGGLAGGALGDRDYYTGLAYEQFYTPLIIQGEIIYADHGPSSATNYGTRALDLYTGKQLWYMPGVTIAFAQVLEADNPNEHGPLPYLWSVSGFGSNVTLTMYDAFSANTGQPPIPYMTIANVSWGGLGMFTRGPTTFGPNGEILSYRFDTAKNRLILWNETKAVDTAFPWVGGEIGQIWNPGYKAVVDGNLGIEWNVSVPTLPPGSNIVETGIVTSTIGGVNTRNVYLLASNTSGSVGAPYAIMQWAYLGSLTKDSNGQYPSSIVPLWNQTRTNVYMSFYKVGNIADNGIYTMFDESNMQFHAYDIKTGQEQWTTDPIPNGWGEFTYDWIVAYGKLYESGYDGHVRAYDATNGKLVWDFYEGSAGYENAYGTYPEYNGFTVADHKVYVANDEHSPDAVMWRGGKLWAINADTGQGVWNISGWDRHPAISDGILTAINSLDGQAYTFGKGPSATTVSAPQTGVTSEQTVTITGSVTDQSPGQPNTPAISDKDMAAWMEYLHMQKPKPADATGVSVDLTAIDSSGKSVNIGTATSDSNGNFGYSWTPTTPGLYKIIATFAGTNSYGDSSATAYLTVVAAPSAAPTATSTPTTAPTPTPIQSASPSTPTSPTGSPDTALYVAIAAAIIIVVLAAVAVVLKRRR